jgi:HEAT repeat protein
MNDEDPRVRAGATFALSLRPPGESVIPALLKALHDQDAKVRTEAADSIGRLGPMAKIAVPSLLSAIDDNDESVRQSAALALCAVDPVTAKKNERILRPALGIPDDLPGIHYPFPPR